jgi:hypothetical protein
MQDTRTLLDALLDRERELRALDMQLRESMPNARDYSTSEEYDAAARLHDDMRARIDELIDDVTHCAWTFGTPQWNDSRARRTLRRTSTPRRSDYDHYVVVLTSDEVSDVANVLASIGLMFDGVTLSLNDADGVLACVTPDDVRRAHTSLLDALQHRWLGVHDTSSTQTTSTTDPCQPSTTDP